MQVKLCMDSLSVLLFCSDLIVTDHNELTNEEWFHVEKLLKNSSKKTPSRLFGMNKDTMLNIIGIDEYIVDKLLKRKTYLDELLFSIANLESEGIYITTKYEDNYPANLSIKLKKRMPLYLYYVGDLSLANEHLVSIVGAQSIDKKVQSFVRNMTTKIFDEDKILISGDNKGVDAFALRKHLALGGKAVCFVCDHMFDYQKKYSKVIKENRLLLLSAVDPYTYFDVTNALDRNGYICGLSEVQFITSTQINSGAVWFTTIQNLHYHWTKQFVLVENRFSGNVRLIEMGVSKVTYEDALSLLTIDQVLEKNETQVKLEEAVVDQMSIYEFLGESHG